MLRLVCSCESVEAPHAEFSTSISYMSALLAGKQTRSTRLEAQRHSKPKVEHDRPWSCLDVVPMLPRNEQHATRMQADLLECGHTIERVGVRLVFLSVWRLLDASLCCEVECLVPA